MKLDFATESAPERFGCWLVGTWQHGPDRGSLKTLILDGPTDKVVAATSKAVERITRAIERFCATLPPEPEDDPCDTNRSP